MQKTTSAYSAYVKGIKERIPFSLIGLLFILIGFIVMPLILFNMINKLRAPYENYDYDKIVKEGNVQQAKITWIERNNTTRINGVNPRVVTFKYIANSQHKEEHFQTLDVEKLENLRVADSIQISVWNNEAVILDIKPFSFPYEYLWFAPLIFILIGWMLYSSAHKAGKRYVHKRNVS